MCLLVNQPAIEFSNEFLSDVYLKNQDGLGVMYAEDGKVHVYKCLPANAQDFIDFYRKHAANRQCVWHARMQTHGDIDMENCHPYRVTDDIWLAHNGILSMGNSWDTTKSDTWHFIKNVLRPALEANPDLMQDDDWIDFIGRVIGGSNKFALVRSDGVISIVNESAGTTFQTAWLSNTYAWSPHKFGHGVKNQSRYAYGDYDYWTGDIRPKSQAYQSVGKSLLPHSLREERIDTPKEEVDRRAVRKFLRAAYNQYMRRNVSGLRDWVLQAPLKAATLLEFYYDDCSGIGDLADNDPEEAAEWIAEIFEHGFADIE